MDRWVTKYLGWGVDVKVPIMVPVLFLRGLFYFVLDADPRLNADIINGHFE